MKPQSKIQAIKLLLNGLAEYYGTMLTPNRLSMYAEDLDDLELDEIGRAIKLIRRDPAQNFFPLPSKIRECIKGNARDEALEASNRIVQAMGKFGWTNPEGARAFIGELGWRVVEREGGWQGLCQRTTDDALPTFKAQWRELAAATLRREQAGVATAPGLPSSQEQLKLKSESTGPIQFGNLLEKIEVKK